MKSENTETKLNSKESKGVEVVIGGTIKKTIEKAEVKYSEEYDRKILTLQIIATVSVMIVVLISPLRLIDSDINFSSSYFYVTIGFIVSGIVPSIIAIFNFMKGRAFCLYLSTIIYSAWILVLSTFFWEVILLSSVLIIYFEITKMLQKIEPMLVDIKSIAKGGAYYHANVFLKRYLRFVLLSSSILVGSSVLLGIFGMYVITLIQGDIIFSIFIIIVTILTFIITKQTLTLDMKKLIAKQAKKKQEEELAKTHSKYA